MPDYSWEIAQQMRSGDYWRPRFQSGGINRDLTTYPGWWETGSGQRVTAQGQPINTVLDIPSVTGSASRTTLKEGENPYWTVSNVKSQPIQDAVNQTLADWAKSRTSYQDALAKFKNESDASRASTRNFLDAENKYVGGWYDGTEQGRLDAITNAWKTADQASRDIALAKAVGSMNDLGLLGRSDVQRLRTGAGAMADIYTQANARAAAQDLANFWAAKNMQGALLGRRLTNESAWVDTGLKPLQAQMSTDQAINNLLAQINAADKTNMFYGLATNYNPWTPNVGTVPQVWPNQNYGYGGNYGANYGSNYGYNYNPFLMAAVNAMATRNYQLPQRTPAQTWPNIGTGEAPQFSNTTPTFGNNWTVIPANAGADTGEAPVWI